VSFRVEITQTALDELDAAFRWLEEQAPMAAARWRESMLKAAASLADKPKRCPLAPESSFYPGELRHMIVGNRRSAYRLLFEIRGKSVVILRVRHSAQDLLDPQGL
jgi:plasmid stabilization system protein ParE